MKSPWCNKEEKNFKKFIQFFKKIETNNEKQYAKHV